MFNNRNTIATGADPVNNPKMSPQELHDIWSCNASAFDGPDAGNTLNLWSEVPSLGITPGSAQDGPIVPWGVNSASGTFASFRDYIRNATGDAAFDPDAGACVRKITASNAPPFENDIKPLLDDVGANLNNNPTSADNPENWIWWGSWGELNGFPYKSSYTKLGTLYTAFAAPVLGVTPNGGNVSGNTYPIGRTVYHVTKNTDADCPQSGGACAFTANPGPALPAGGTDLNVTGGTSGRSGAVREFTRWLCRVSSTQQPTDPYTGINNNLGITQAINKAGFTTVPSALRTAGSRCQVLT